MPQAGGEIAIRPPEPIGAEEISSLASWAGSSQARPHLLMGSYSPGLLCRDLPEISTRPCNVGSAYKAVAFLAGGRRRWSRQQKRIPTAPQGRWLLDTLCVSPLGVTGNKTSPVHRKGLQVGNNVRVCGFEHGDRTGKVIFGSEGEICAPRLSPPSRAHPGSRVFPQGSPMASPLPMPARTSGHPADAAFWL